MIHSPSSWRFVVTLAIALSAGVSVVLLAFTWTSVASAPRDIPVSIAGPAPLTASTTDAIESSAGDTFVLTEVGSREDAVVAVEQRHSLGAIVFDPEPEVLVASAASPAVAQLLGEMAGRLEQAANAAATARAGGGVVQPITIEVVDIVPLASSDERGAGLVAAAFPVVIAGFLGGVLISLLVRGSSRRFAALAVFSVGAGVGLALVLHPVLRILQGSLPVAIVAIALAVASMASLIVGAHATLGRPGMSAGVVTIMLVANPIAAATQPWQFLPQPWGLVGQWFQPGAIATLLRDLSYFPDSRYTAFAWSVLAAWALVGFGLTAIGLEERRILRREARSSSHGNDTSTTSVGPVCTN